MSNCATKETMSCDRNCSHSTKPYSIEKPASDRPLEAYVVGRIYQLEAQVAEQQCQIERLRAALDQYAANHRGLMGIVKPSVDLTTDGEIRKLNIGKSSCIYCKYDSDTYYALVAYFGLAEENYKACMQEYENEILNGIETDLSDDERSAIKIDYEAKLKNEGADNDAD